MSRLRKLIEELCPDGVEFLPLNDIATFGGGKTPSKKDPSNYCENGINWMTSKDVKATRLWKSGITISDKGATGLTLYPAGTIVMVARSGILQKYLPIAILCEPSTVNQDLKTISAIDGIEPMYLLYALQAKSHHYLAKYSKAGTVDSVEFESIKREPLPIPPHEVQCEIVRILDTMQKLDSALSNELNEREKLFLEALDSVIEQAASSANVSKFGDVATIARGASPRPIKSFMAGPEDGIHWIKIGDVPVGGKYITDTAEYVTAEGAEKSRFLTRGSFILSNSMSFGRPYIIDIDGCIHDGWLSITEYEHTFDKDFLYYLLRSTRVQKQWKMAASSGTVSNLNADIVKDTDIVIPDITLQVEYAQKLDALMSLINTIECERIARLKQFKYYRDKLLDFPEKAV